MRSSAKNIRILLVDDTPLVLKTVQYLLSRRHGLSVVGSSTSGAESIEMVRHLKPDLVVMDLNMPGMNGIDAAREIKRRPDAPRVIIFSFESALAWQAAAKEAGVDAWCDKRDPSADLLGAIRKLFPDSGESGNGS